jgi:hypothetical protein
MRQMVEVDPPPAHLKNLSENAQASLRTIRWIIAILIQASLNARGDSTYSMPHCFDRLDHSKVGFASENKASPVGKISSSGIETYQFPLTMWARK